MIYSSDRRCGFEYLSSKMSLTVRTIIQKIHKKIHKKIHNKKFFKKLVEKICQINSFFFCSVALPIRKSKRAPVKRKRFAIDKSSSTIADDSNLNDDLAAEFDDEIANERADKRHKPDEPTEETADVRVDNPPPLELPDFDLDVSLNDDIIDAADANDVIADNATNNDIPDNDSDHSELREAVDNNDLQDFDFDLGNNVYTVLY